jgi:glycolate oxidase iron-sulfur subunit
MCLPVCPTYALTADERSSPRGRIRLIRSVADESLALSAEFAEEMHFCLDCQACQTACPAGVRYGDLVEEARNWVADAGLESAPLRLVKRFFLRGVLSSRSRTKAFGLLLRWYGQSGLREAVERSGLLSLLPATLGGRLLLLPHASDPFFDDAAPQSVPAVGERRGRVALLTGCIMNIAFADVHRDAVTVLARSGFDVVIPPGQGCCGALHGHNGDHAESARLARELSALLAGVQGDAVVVDSAGCAAHLKSYGSILPGEEQAAATAARTREITEFLHERGCARPARALGSSVTYHEACHLVHSQGISRAPRELLGSIPGTPMRELPEATWCCGSAGVYSVTRFDDAMALLDRKMANIASTGAQVVATANPGCHLQIAHGAARGGLALRVVHPVTLLRESTDPA